MFRLSPRTINEVYAQYTRNCQKVSTTKNYNKMVDQIMELSTTYSMIPGDSRDPKKKRNGMAEETRETSKE
jgi:hypothetical protein